MTRHERELLYRKLFPERVGEDGKYHSPLPYPPPGYVPPERDWKQMFFSRAPKTIEDAEKIIEKLADPGAEEE